MGAHISSCRILNIGAPQGCVLSPLLYCLYTQDCTATKTSNAIVKFADDTVVIGLISNNNEAAYFEEVALLSTWCKENNLVINVSKTKEIVVDQQSTEESGAMCRTHHRNKTALSRGAVQEKLCEEGTADHGRHSPPPP
ncbi:hypothetical protein WMY93_000140 [Mugilogobius chulae]|uniref:Reverse transcriptase domain-containing protein n=1 Tax=Mugilogobius chulae TaxID=88201 RepID=A0AAW0Q969_9GOBI